MAKGYSSRQEVENYLLITIDASFYAQIDTWLGEIEQYIDQITGRNFKADVLASARYYDGDNSSKLLIDDAVAVTEIKIADDVLLPDSDPLLADGDFILYPANKLPITKIVLRGSIFPRWPLRCVKITGKWGYSVAVPVDIKQVATILLAGIINYSLNAEGEVKTMTIGRYSVTYKDEKNWQDFDRINEILKYYKKFTF